MSQNQPTTLSKLFIAGLLSLAAAPASSQAQAPRLGQVQKLSVMTVSLDVGSTEKETKRITYSPPPGWYVRSHAVVCQKKAGHSSFTVNTVPRDWNFLSEEKVNESYKTLIDLAGQAKDAGLKARFALEQQEMLNHLRAGRSSHHALVVEATAKGEGFLRGGGSLQLTVLAELVYVGTEEGLVNAVAQVKGGLQKQKQARANQPLVIRHQP